MNIIAMKTGKSKLIPSLVSGKTLLVNRTDVNFNYEIKDLFTIKVSNLLELKGELFKEYDTVIFYTHMKQYQLMNEVQINDDVPNFDDKYIFMIQNIKICY